MTLGDTSGIFKWEEQPDDNKGYYFVFAGENVLCKGRYAMSYITKAAKQYRNRVIYLGRLDRSKLFPVIKGATVIVLPSIMENFANSCVEAMALGQIVVGTDGATYEQLITDGKSGFLAKPGDSQTLKTAIEKALALSQEDRYIMGKSAIRRIEQLCPEKTVRKLFAYYEYIIKKYQEKK